MIVEIRHVQHFLAICEHGSFARAAESLGITQSALTQSIARLEKSLHCRLFDRGRQGAVATDAGRLLLPRAKLIFAEASLAAAELRGIKGSAAPRVAIGVSKGVRYDIIPNAIGRALKQIPNLSIVAVEGWSPELYAKLLNGDLDLVVSAPLPQVPISLELQQEPLFEQRESPMIGTLHPLAGRADITLSDLTDQLWLSPPQGNDARVRYLERVFQDAGLRPPSRYLTSDSTTLNVQLLRNGYVVSTAMVDIIDTLLEPDMFRVLEIPELTFPRIVSLSVRRRGRSQAGAKLLCDCVRAAAQELAQSRRRQMSKGTR
jgi:DNA-binding transcriptional LysR family regulator